jgi:hypothetical protein
MLLLSLIGEQPIPNLLPIRYLKPGDNLLVYTRKTETVARRLRRIINGSENLHDDLLVGAFDIDDTMKCMHARLDGIPDVVFNLTGGTKMMALSAYALASQRGSDFVYLESEGHKSLLYRYQFTNGFPEQKNPPLQLPELLTSAAEYLNAHLPGFTLTDFSRDEKGRITPGGFFEQAIFNSLKERGMDVLANVKPLGVAEQVEIDLVVRIGNQAGIAEVKLGGSREAGKKGLDQLKMAGEPAYLGTYTAQFMVIAGNRLFGRSKSLADERGVTVICLPEYESGKPLPKTAADRLHIALQTRLGLPNTGLISPSMEIGLRR